MVRAVVCAVVRAMAFRCPCYGLPLSVVVTWVNSAQELWAQILHLSQWVRHRWGKQRGTTSVEIPTSLESSKPCLWFPLRLELVFINTTEKLGQISIIVTEKFLLAAHNVPTTSFRIQRIPFDKIQCWRRNVDLLSKYGHRRRKSGETWRCLWKSWSVEEHQQMLPSYRRKTGRRAQRQEGPRHYQGHCHWRRLGRV